MKQLIFTSFLLTFLTAHLMQAQVPRTMLVEHFSNASCGPCASQNPALQSLLVANPGVVYLKYQVNWPGTDPMNAHNPSQVNVRVNFYDVTGVPTTVFEGNVYKGSPASFNQTMINNRANASSPFSLSLSKRFSPAMDSIYVTAIYRKEADTSTSGVYVRIAILEKLIHFNTAPGSNGEKDFHHVMKRMLPNGVGTAVPNDLAVGEYDTIELGWKLTNIYETDQLMAVAFIQNINNKNVYQAASSETMSTLAEGEVGTPAIQAWPNPASNVLNLSFPTITGGALALYNAAGQMVYQENLAENTAVHAIPVDSLPAGLYICTLSNESSRISTRILIQAQ